MIHQNTAGHMELATMGDLIVNVKQKDTRMKLHSVTSLGDSMHIVTDILSWVIVTSIIN